MRGRLSSCWLAALLSVVGCDEAVAPHLDAGAVQRGIGSDASWGPVDGSAGLFTVAVLPDTQLQSGEVFDAQTGWLADNGQQLNLQIVAHVGDVVNESNDGAQWQRAREAMSLLDGAVPYVIAPGNHDYGARKELENAKDRSTRLQEFFPRSLFEEMPTFGGFAEPNERVDSSFHVFEVAGEKWIVMALEFGPRAATVDWADRVLADHADHRALIVTHAYLYTDGQRYDWAKYGESQPWNPHSPRYGLAAQPGGVHDGEELWQELLIWHPNVVAVLCGHAHGNGSIDPLEDGVARGMALGAESEPFSELLANYQDQPLGGAGFLRLLQFDPAARTVQVETYSPYLDMHKDDPQNRFKFEYGPLR